jgi:hypothetical protein
MTRRRRPRRRSRAGGAGRAGQAGRPGPFGPGLFISGRPDRDPLAHQILASQTVLRKPVNRSSGQRIGERAAGPPSPRRGHGPASRFTQLVANHFVNAPFQAPTNRRTAPSQRIPYEELDEVSLTGTLPCARRDLCVPNRKKHRTSYPEPIFEPTCLTLERNDGGAKFKPD